MKKYRLSLLCFLICVFMSWLSVSVPAHAGLEIIPTDHDFGEVEVGSFATVVITLTNDGYEPIIINSIDFETGSNPDFEIAAEPPPDTELGNNESADVEVTFTPSSEGYESAILAINWCNGASGTEHVFLAGAGVTQSSPVTIEDILAFFYAGVDGGTIDGAGYRDAARDSHLKVFEWRLLLVAFFLDKGSDRVACMLLWNAYGRSDGQDRPKDFIVGEDVAELNARILQLIADLGCPRVGGRF